MYIPQKKNVVSRKAKWKKNHNRQESEPEPKPPHSHQPSSVYHNPRFLLMFMVLILLSIFSIHLKISNSLLLLNNNVNSVGVVVEKDNKPTVDDRISTNKGDDLQQHQLGGGGEDKSNNNNNNDGWNSIHVFYGKEDIMPSLRKAPIEQKWHSQANQDLFVYTMLREKKNGYFLDLAANDPTFLSNSYSLERDHGWKGICVEANPLLWNALSFRKCHVVGAVVSKNRMETVKFSANNDGINSIYGGIVGNDFDMKRATQNSETLTRYTVPLLEILDKMNAPLEIDYWSLDVEGAESSVLQSFPFDKYSFRIMSIERPKDDAINLLTRHGYICLKKYRFGETIWAKTSILQELDLHTHLGLTLEKVTAADGFEC